MRETILANQLKKALAKCRAYERSLQLLTRELGSLRHDKAQLEAELAEKEAEIKELKKAKTRSARAPKPKRITKDNDSHADSIHTMDDDTNT